MRCFVLGATVTYMKNTENKEILHSFKDQQLSNKLFYLVAIYIGLRRNFLLQFDIKFITRDPKLAEIHNDLSNKYVISKVALRMRELMPRRLILRSIVKVQLLKSHLSNKSSSISADLGYLVKNSMSSCS